MNTAYQPALVALPKPPTVDDMEGFIGEAKREYANQKSSAMKSAAYAYLTWHYGASEHAEPEMRKWLDEQIKNANAGIEKFNSDVDNDKRRAKELAENTINEELSDEEKARLTELQKRTSAQWAQAKQVKIDARAGASKFTSLVKYVFCFVKPADASLVSRHAKVLEYIEQHKDELAGVFTVDAIVALLDAAGGFEAALEKARSTEPANSDKVRAATLTKIKEAMDRVDDSNELAITAKYGTNGYVFLVGRSTATGVTICGQLDISNDNEAEELLFKIDEDVIGSAEPTVDFMARVVSIGELVREGREGNVTKDGTNAGEKHKVTRTYSLTNFGGKQNMVVSARYGEASAVVHAWPKSEIIVGTVEEGQGLLLDPSTSSMTTKLFSNAARRLLMTVNVGPGDPEAPVHWKVVTDLNGDEESITFAWKSMYHQMHCPIDMRNFDPNSTISLTHADLRQVYSEYLHEWLGTKKDDKNVGKALTVAIDGINFAVGHEAFGHKSYAFGSKQGASASLQMRPRDVVDLFRKLIELNVPHVALHCDTDGLLAASWGDNVGDYIIYLPTIDKRGGLDRTCLGQMKPKK
jgi:hypothetical protein